MKGRRAMWQPIETAPKDGTTVFVFGKHGSLYSVLGRGYDAVMVRAVARYDCGRWTMTMPDETPTVSVTESEWDGPSEAHIEPTHWMPIPEPPAKPIPIEGSKD